MSGDSDPRPIPQPRPGQPWPVFRLKIWQLGLLVAFAAYTIVDIQDHRVTDPVLIALALAGFAAYAALAWPAWAFATRFDGRVSRLTLIGVYLASMAGLFLLATVIYLVIEHLYLGGRF